MSWMGWWGRLGESFTPFFFCPFFPKCLFASLLSRDVLTLCVNSILCSEYAIKRIDEPFVKDNEDKEEWAL